MFKGDQHDREDTTLLLYHQYESNSIYYLLNYKSFMYYFNRIEIGFLKLDFLILLIDIYKYLIFKGIFFEHFTHTC